MLWRDEWCNLIESIISEQSKEKAMDSGVKERIEAVKFYLIIFACAFIVAVYTCKPLEEPEFIKNESGEIISCSICNERKEASSKSEVEGQGKALVPEAVNRMALSDAAKQVNAPVTGAVVHGKVMSIDENHIKHAIVEHVELYPKEHAQSEQTITRNGMLVRYPQAKATVLVCHGFMCDRFDVGLLRQIFNKDYNIMTFDFRAHGENRAGQFCTFGRDESQDVITAARFLRNHSELQDKPLFVYGFSMGAAASIEAQSQVDLFDAMVLDCPFDSTENVIKRGLDNMKITLWGYEFGIPGRSYLEQYAFHPYVQSLVKMALKTVANFDPQDIQITLHPCSPVESIKKVSVPCFFIHCKNDEKVPLEAVKNVFEGAQGPKKLWVTNGRRHFDSFFYNPEKYAQEVKSFLQLVLQQPSTIAIAIDDAIIEDKDQINSVEKNNHVEAIHHCVKHYGGQGEDGEEEL